jgi:hypothetical protein
MKLVIDRAEVSPPEESVPAPFSGSVLRECPEHSGAICSHEERQWTEYRKPWRS